ncbi:phosphonate metabolism protein/1,5-bisphosphokinase (PRPP-forming) PhnN [Microbacterium murale]|uniref:Ribose 1,5-bisphosphate phosphokinase PhnN n=1 Tax=Microbacterium murale TaxID=1081040 RepID=A0ABU0PBS5_9MICO|nr:phosphonate metabolism protein/1,5-bisphosphokinase (PRPP-forming) PhnN [Microbacterium murale]MDQ0644778.1 ribose 1,5-bisphosphokinase [Microbacterium murale]
MTGVFVAIVGPSGAGKDTIIERAKAALADCDDIVFPRRIITRPTGEGEECISVTADDFAVAEDHGELAVSWRAHGLAYGIPVSARTTVAAGGVVVANVSRGVIAQLPDLFGESRVVRVTVSDEIRLARIIARGRETRDAAATRVARADPAPEHPVDLEIVNDGTLDEACAQLVEFLHHVRAVVPR